MSRLEIIDPYDRFIMDLKAGNLKGRTKITLEDISTRRREVFEDENMITGAIGKIMSSNYLGMTDYFRMLPVKNLLGGCMLFANSLTEDQNNIFPPADSVNHLVGHAGSSTYSGSSTTRGQPNGTASVIDPANGLIKNVWDWGLEQANGEINAVALTSGAGGNFALYPDGSAPMLKSYGLGQSGTTIFSALDAGGTTWNRARALRCPVALDQYGNGVSLWVDGTTFEEIKVRHPFVYAELIEDPACVAANYRELGSRTATLSRSYTAGYTVIGQDDSNYYVMERDSSTATRLHVDVIAKSDMARTALTLDITESLLRYQTVMCSMYSGIVSGGNIYWISNSNQKTFVRINIATPADVDVLTSNLSSNISMYQEPIVLSEGLVLGRNFLINGEKVYPVAARDANERLRVYNESTSSNFELGTETIAQYNKSPYMYQMPAINDSATYTRCSTGGVLMLAYMASVNNLSQSVTKNANKTMRLEYSIVEGS